MTHTSATESVTETCVLVAEVIGYDLLFDKIGQIETFRAVERSRKRAERSVDAYQGVTVSAKERCLVAHFPRADNAILAAFDMLTRVKQLPPVSGVALSVHIAIHGTRLDAESQQPEPDAITLASGLVAASAPNQILVSSETLPLLSDAMSRQLIAEPADSVTVAGYHNTLYTAFPQSHSHTHGDGEEAFSPTSTSLSIANPDHLEATDPAPQALSPSNGTPLRRSLVLRHRSNNVVVSDSRPRIVAGREEGNDLLVLDPRVSRHHARIELRAHGFVLVDSSTNGTFMIDEAGREHILKRNEMGLPDHGRIGFGYSPAETGAEVVYFDIAQK
jgi:adenylate cyclase